MTADLLGRTGGVDGFGRSYGYGRMLRVSPAAVVFVLWLTLGAGAGVSGE